MSLRFVPLTSELLAWAAAEEADAGSRALLTPEVLAVYLPRPPGYGEAMLGRGRVLAAGGLVPLWPERAIAWLMLSPHATVREKALALRRVQAGLARAPFRRVEMQVRTTEPWCRRFAARLGFAEEGVMRAYDPDGRDYGLFARVAEAG